MENRITQSETLAKFKAAIDEKITLANKAVSDGNLKAYYDTVAELEKVEKDYADVYASIVYDELLKSDKPIIAAISRYSYPILRHTEIKDKDTHQITELALKEKVKQIDLLKFCKYGKLDSLWQYDVQKFNQLLCLRAAKELKFSAAEIKKITKTFYLEEQARKIEMGETPDSNTQICKMLQKVIDSIVCAADSNAEKPYKCNNHDVSYLLMCYTKKGKNALGVAVAKHDVLRRLVMDVCYRIITNGRYDLEYKTIKTPVSAKSPEQSAAKPAEKKAAKPAAKPKAKKAEKKPADKKSEPVQAA